MNAVKAHWLAHAPERIRAARRYHSDSRKTTDLIFAPVPPIRCADGFTMSVQAGCALYCAPRVTDATCPYTKWEVGYPSEREETLMPFVDGDGTDHRTVYGFVPTEVIEAIIAKHGGIALASDAVPSPERGDQANEQEQGR